MKQSGLDSFFAKAANTPEKRVKLAQLPTKTAELDKAKANPEQESPTDQ